MIGTINLALSEKDNWNSETIVKNWRLEGAKLYVNSGSLILRHKDIKLSFESYKLAALGGLEDDNGMVFIGFASYEGVYYKYLLDFWPVQIISQN